MKPFMDDEFLLNSETASKLYHNYAEKSPIFDYHCHLNPKDIAEDRQFKNITEVWLDGDHYKWRAMRANGIEEEFLTGSASPRDKFKKWAETVPYTMRNPLFHWTHLELKRYFGIDELLTPESAEQIYNKTAELLQKPEYSCRSLLKMMNVKVICTTDDPIDSLEYHKLIKNDGFEVKVLPTFRPDRAMAIEKGKEYLDYLKSLENVSGTNISTFTHLMEVIELRHDYFHEVGCRLADHGVGHLYSTEYTVEEVDEIFSKALNMEKLSELEISRFKSAFLHHCGILNHKKSWIQQFHFGVFRNTNTRCFNRLGPDTGFDSMADFTQGTELKNFLDRLDRENALTKTVLYNLNPVDNALVATMAGNFQDGITPGKIQFGSGWWFLDQKDGIIDQINTLSNMGLLSRFVGMLTDSRSFLSFPRHEYFRRVLCNLIGEDVERGELPEDYNLLGTMIENICYRNIKEYFGEIDE